MGATKISSLLKKKWNEQETTIKITSETNKSKIICLIFNLNQVNRYIHARNKTIYNTGIRKKKNKVRKKKGKVRNNILLTKTAMLV